MTITLQLLFDANTAPVRANAEAWTAYAEALDNATEELIRGTRDLEHVWPGGPASAAAHGKVRDTVNEASNAVVPCRTIGRALREWADTITSLQNTLKSITAEAAAAGFQVDVAAGTVSAPQHMYQQSAAPHVIAQAVNSYMHQLQGLVESAATIDASTASTLRQNLPDAQAGFGSHASATIPQATVEALRNLPPAEVNSWWNNLTSAQQEQILRDHPHLAGSIDGIPTADRDTGNRTHLATRQAALQTEEDALRAELRGLPPASQRFQDIVDRVHAINDEQAKMAAVTKQLDRLGDNGYLIKFDPAGDGKIVMSVGDPDTATNVATWVAGTGTVVDDAYARDNTDRILNLYQAADAMTPSRQGDVATVMWVDYDAPEWDDSVVTGDRAEAGAPTFNRYVDGLHATNTTGNPHVTAIGHSYGSSLLGEAAKSGGLHVDDIVTAGSPGMRVDHARDLNIDPRHVWAGAGPTDPVSNTKAMAPVLGPVAGWLYHDGHNTSPHYEEFGANRYVADTPVHSSYWDPGSKSLENQALIVMGRYDLVGMVHGQAPEVKP